MTFTIGFLSVLMLLIASWLVLFYRIKVRKKLEVEKIWLSIKRDLLALGKLIQTILMKHKAYLDDGNDFYLVIESICSTLRQVEATDEIMNESRRLFRLLIEIKYDAMPFAISDTEDFGRMISGAFEIKSRICMEWLEYNRLVGKFNQFASKFPNSMAMGFLGEELLPYMDTNE